MRNVPRAARARSAVAPRPPCSAFRQPCGALGDAAGPANGARRRCGAIRLRPMALRLSPAAPDGAAATARRFGSCFSNRTVRTTPRERPGAFPSLAGSFCALWMAQTAQFLPDSYIGDASNCSESIRCKREKCVCPAQELLRRLRRVLPGTGLHPTCMNLAKNVQIEALPVPVPPVPPVPLALPVPPDGVAANPLGAIHGGSCCLKRWRACYDARVQ